MTRNDGQVPNGWRVARLGDVAEVNRHSWNPEDGTSPILYLDLTAVTAPGTMDPPRSIRASDAPSRARRRVRAGDTLVSTVRPYLRGFARVREAPENLIASTGFAVVSPRPIVDGSFVYQHVMTPWFSNHLENAMTGQAYPAVRPRDVAAYSLALPPLPEQRAIAAVLDSIDEAIERAEAVIAATERLRDALLHEMLTRGVPGWHTEWKDVPGVGTIPADWEVVRLGDVAEVKGGKRLPKGSSFADSDTGLPYIRVVDFQNRTVNPRGIKFLRPETQRAISHYTISSLDVFISIAGTIGLVGILPPRLDGANLTENAAKIVIGCATELSQSYLVSFLDSHAGQSQIARRVNALGQPKLALERIRTIQLPLPLRSEQLTIAAAQIDIDTMLERMRETRYGLQLLKASASDALLTGYVRTI